MNKKNNAQAIEQTNAAILTNILFYQKKTTYYILKYNDYIMTFYIG